jgi:hypothetical protein
MFTTRSAVCDQRPTKKTKLKQTAPSKIKKNQSFQVSWDTSENRYDFSKIN